MVFYKFALSASRLVFNFHEADKPLSLPRPDPDICQLGALLQLLILRIIEFHKIFLSASSAIF
jgi:hypothetical protein